ncbi:cytochrome P450 [Myxococcota bacterium]|nr:cytochrome P450 [Myxococcota bacterium]
MSTRVAPGPKGQLVIGPLRELRRDPLGFFLGGAQTYGDIFRVKVGPRTLHFVRAPELVKHVLQDNNKNYGRQTVGYKKLSLALGRGLVTSDGDYWLRQRRIAQPAFHRERITRFARQMTEATESMLARWSAHVDATPEVPIDVATEMMRLTLEIVGMTIFSIDVRDVAPRIGDDVTIVLKHVTDRMTALLGFLDELPTPGNKRFRQALGRLDDFVYGTIRERRTSREDPGDFLSMLMHARDEETGEGMNDVQLRDEVITMFGAGHETTANALVWTLYLLSKTPAVERRLVAELERVLAGRAPTLGDLEQLVYLKNVVKESMRIIPPVWAIGRSATHDDELAGYHIPASTFVLMSPYVTHRHTAYWENPEGFDPDRFEGDRTKVLPRFAYFPFGGGPHLCIGNAFASMEAELVLATVLSRFRVDLFPGHRVEIEPTVTLRPRFGMKMLVSRRAREIVA